MDNYRKSIYLSSLPQLIYIMFSAQRYRKLRLLTFGLNYAAAQLSKNAQRAIWACRIIKQIKEAKQETHFFVQDNKEKDILILTLADTIKSLTVSSFPCLDGELSEQVGKQMLKPFTEGIILSDLFRQKLMNDGTEKLKSQVQLAKSYVFYPSVLVTKFVFKHILEGQRQFLLYGDYGISKTMSIILFQWFSSLVNLYFFKSHETLQQKVQLDKLCEQNLIFSVPKLFYINNKEVRAEKDLVKYIMQQCSQLNLQKQKSSYQQNKNPTTLFKYIQESYSKRGIDFVLMVDSLRPQSQKNRYSQVDKHQYYLDRIRRGTGMQKDLLLALTKKVLTNDSIDFERGQYLPKAQRKLKMLSGKVSFTHLVWHMMQKQLISLSKDPETINKIKLMYYDDISKMKHMWRNYIRIADIEQSIFSQHSVFNELDEYGIQQFLKMNMLEINFIQYDKIFRRQLDQYFYTGQEYQRRQKTFIFHEIFNFADDKATQIEQEQHADEKLQQYQQIEFRMPQKYLTAKPFHLPIRILIQKTGSNKPLPFYYEKMINEERCMVVPYNCKQFGKFRFQYFKAVTPYFKQLVKMSK